MILLTLRKSLLQVLLITFATGAIASSPPASLKIPHSGYFSPEDVLHISIEAPGTTHSDVYVELDQVDVTSRAVFSANRIEIHPMPPLAPGRHELRLVRETPDGEIQELGIWQFEVRQSHWFRRALGGGQAEFAVTAPAEHRHSTAPRPDTVTEGSLALQGLLEDDRWQIAAHGSLIHHSEANIMPEDRRLELAGFQVVSQWQDQTLTLGDQPLPAEGLVLGSRHRRGASAHLRFMDEAIEVRPFVLSTPPLEGFDGGLGVTRPEERMAGTQLSLHSHQLPGQPTLTVTWLSANGHPDGGFGYTPPLASDVMSTAVRTTLPPLDLVLSAEHARSRTDFDTSSSLLGRLHDSAWQTGVTWQPEPEPDGSRTQAGLQWVRVEADFFSPGNTGLPADKTGWQAWGQWQGQNTQFSLSASRETDNVSQDPSRPTLADEQANLDLSMALPEEAHHSTRMSFWVAPFMDLGLAWSRQRHRDLPGGWGGWPVNQVLRSARVQVGAAPDRWQWALTWYQEHFQDTTGTQPDYDRQQPGLNLSFSLLQSWQLEIAGTWDRTHAHQPESINEALNARWQLSGAFSDIPLSLSISHTLNRTLTGNASQNEYSHTLAFSADWTAVAARSSSPAVILFARGSYQDDRSDAALTGDSRQVMIGVRLQSQFGNSGGIE